jgi:hypothetical protein
MTSRLVTFACDSTRCLVPLGFRMEVGVPVLVGREGDVPVGVDLEDLGVSRRAAVVTATADGWDVQVENRNGVVLHPWGQAPSLARRREVLTWPLVGLRVRGSDEAVQHWVLLEAESVEPAPSGPTARSGPATRTARSRASDPLTGPQLDALRTVFAAHLQWPPVQPAVALQLKQAARRLGLSESGVQDRLLKARERAVHLGLHTAGGATDAEFLFFLVRAGLVAPPRGVAARAERHPAGVEAAAQQPVVAAPWAI